MKKSLRLFAVVLAMLVSIGTYAQFKQTSTFTKNKTQLSASSQGQQPQVKAGRMMLTHSVAQDIVGGTVACSDQTTGYTSENHFVRKFDLINDFQISAPFYVTSVEFGVENAASGLGTGQPITIDLYKTTGSLNYTNMTLIGTLDTIIPDMTLGVWSAPITATVGYGEILVVDINNLDGQPFSHTFFAGSNSLGETSPSYLAADSCGVANPATYASIGFGTINLVINVYGDVSTGVNQQSDVSIHTWPNPANDRFNMELPSGDWSVQLMNVNGQVVYSELLNGRAQINTAELGTGIYFLRAENGTQSFRQKLMVR